MPDSRAAFDVPHDWGEAFAALPAEAPPAGTWSAIAARLPRRRSDARRRDRTYRPYRFAVAAALALAALVPAFRWLENPGADPSRPAPAVAAPAIVSSGSPATSIAAPDEPASIAPPSMPEDPAASPAAVAATAIPRSDGPASAGKVAPGSRPDGAVQAAAASELQQQLESLYAESGRLEAVLAQLQEPRATSATAAALSGELQDRIAALDGALSQPDLPPASQVELWQQRIEALRQLTGVETTQRWLAAQGTATEGPLVQVY